jgi:sugar lactone lactonase YvrE
MHPRSLSPIALLLAFLLAACGGGGSSTTPQRAPLSLAGTVSTVAGTGVSTFAGSAPSFYDPIGVVRVGAYLYVTDTGIHSIRRVDIATGETTTFAGTGVSGSADGTGTSAAFGGPTGIASDGTNLYVSVNHSIRKIVIATAEVTTLAGTGLRGATDGAGSVATFDQPGALWTDGATLYVSDSGNGRIRKVAIATGDVTTVPRGSGGYYTPPRGMTSPDGTNLYLTASDNTIRKMVIATGDVTTLAGASGFTLTPAADGTGSAARFNAPSAISTDGTNLYVLDRGNEIIRKVVIATGEATTLAGGVGIAGFADGTGSAARFSLLSGIDCDGTDLYVADRRNNAVRKVAIATGEVTTVAGAPASSADGAAGAATFHAPMGLASWGTNLYVADTENHTIRKIAIPTGEVTTLAGSPGCIGSADGTGFDARFHSPMGIATDGANLYVADSYNCSIRKVVIATGEVTTVAGSAGEYGDIDGTGAGASFRGPFGVATDGTNLYVTDAESHTIRKVVIATGEVTTVAGASGIAGHANGTGAAATFDHPHGIALDGGILYVTDQLNCTIRKIVLATGAVTTLAGFPGLSGTEDGTGSEARLLYPEGVVSDGTNLYVSDSNQTVRKVVIATGEVTTLAGSPGMPGFGNGTGSGAQFYFPVSLATDGESLFVADCFNNVIRRIR